MDKNILKKFAIESRQDLMDKIRNKIRTFYIDEDFNSEQKGDIYILSNEKHSLNLTNEEFKKRELLIKRVRELSLEQVIEEAAYTWFNRVIAIRYMEINDMLPLTKDNQSLGIRVLSSRDNTPDPEILKFTNLINPDLDIDFKKEKFAELKDENEKFKYVLLLVCKKLGKVIPQVFDGVTDYIDILIPDNLLNDTGIVTKIVNEVPEKNYNQVEIIGWLYQYYNQAEKDRVIMAKKAYKKNEIAYATQLFTSDWIVKYMVDNSLGRYYEETNSNSIASELEFYINENEKNCENNSNLSPADIKFFDPCCGSGHILVYAFELLYKMYSKNGYNKNDIPKLILKNNLYGLDIDDRAGQLSILSILLKAREYDKNIFNKLNSEEINIMSIKESKDTYCNLRNEITDTEQFDYLINIFKNAKEIGSIIKIDSDYNYLKMEEEIENNLTIFGIEMKENILPLIKQFRILSNKYDIVVTNPPYMNSSNMPVNLKGYIQKHYSDVKNDLFSVFIAKVIELSKENGRIGLLTPYVWMFISSYEKLRTLLLNNVNITSMIQLEYNAFEGACVPVCSFCLKNTKKQEKGVYIRLSDFKGVDNQAPKALEAIRSNNCYYKYSVDQKDYFKIPGTPIAYWISKNMLNAFVVGKQMNKFGTPRTGIMTGDNNRFLRLWWEVENEKSALYCNTSDEAINSKKKWFPYNKGGDYRRWYGNNDYLINWYDSGEEVFGQAKAEKRNSQDYPNEYKFKQAISWSLITSSVPAFRKKEHNLSDIAGPSFFCDKEYFNYLLGFCNSKIATNILNMLNPTINFQGGNIAQLPIIIGNKDKVETIVDENIAISKNEWDSFETSWDFKHHPLIPLEMSNKNKLDIESIYENWKEVSEKNFEKLKENEEKLNEILINVYELGEELTSDIDEKNITIRKADREREIKSLISYSVGCMFGRYSLDEDGLIYAGGIFDTEKYTTYKVDNDNIIPITDEAYFGDDIVERFKDFIRTVYGKETFNKNMDFIAESLSKKGTETSEERIRRYFLNEFFVDHCNNYSVTGSGKRPIYWLLDSGKKNGFKALIYMHRYNENLIPKARLDYLHRVQTTYEKLLSDVNYRLTTELSMTDKKEAKNRQTDLMAKLQEIKEYDEKIAHIANQRISIDLDDGVKTNYEKFKDILAKIK